MTFLTITCENVWILKHDSRDWSSDTKSKIFSNVVWASILRHGWANPTFLLVLEAVLSNDSAGSGPDSYVYCQQGWSQGSGWVIDAHERDFSQT